MLISLGLSDWRFATYLSNFAGRSIAKLCACESTSVSNMRPLDPTNLKNSKTLRPPTTSKNQTNPSLFLRKYHARRLPSSSSTNKYPRKPFKPLTPYAQSSEDRCPVARYTAVHPQNFCHCVDKVALSSMSSASKLSRSWDPYQKSWASLSNLLPYILAACTPTTTLVEKPGRNRGQKPTHRS